MITSTGEYQQTERTNPGQSGRQTDRQAGTQTTRTYKKTASKPAHRHTDRRRTLGGRSAELGKSQKTSSRVGERGVRGAKGERGEVTMSDRELLCEDSLLERRLDFWNREGSGLDHTGTPCHAVLNGTALGTRSVFI